MRLTNLNTHAQRWARRPLSAAPSACATARQQVQQAGQAVTAAAQAGQQPAEQAAQTMRQAVQQMSSSSNSKKIDKEEALERGLLNWKPKKQTELEGLRIELQEITGLRWVAEHRFHSERKWRIDLACPTLKIAIEQDGGLYMPDTGHRKPSRIIKDMEKQNVLTLLGWRILRFTPQQVKASDPVVAVKEMRG